MSFLIEIATSDFSTTAMAVAGGADRIELCNDLAEGGTTPSYGTIRACREAFSLPIFPIIRPRGGDFCFSVDELELMLYDVRLCKSLGCEGIVTGLLLPDGQVDIRATARLVEAAYPMDVTFHRAFDRSRDAFEALEGIIEAGCTRILTSGQRPTAPEGADLIRQLVKAADDRIVIMPGSGVRKENIARLASDTGAREFHTSLRGRRASASDYRHPHFPESDSYSNPAVEPEEVRALRAALVSVSVE